MSALFPFLFQFYFAAKAQLAVSKQDNQGATYKQPYDALEFDVAGPENRGHDQVCGDCAAEEDADAIQVISRARP